MLFSRTWKGAHGAILIFAWHNQHWWERPLKKILLWLNSGQCHIVVSSSWNTGKKRPSQVLSRLPCTFLISSGPRVGSSRVNQATTLERMQINSLSAFCCDICEGGRSLETPFVNVCYHQKRNIGTPVLLQSDVTSRHYKSATLLFLTLQEGGNMISMLGLSSVKGTTCEWRQDMLCYCKKKWNMKSTLLLV